MDIIFYYFLGLTLFSIYPLFRYFSAKAEDVTMIPSNRANAYEVYDKNGVKKANIFGSMHLNVEESEAKNWIQAFEVAQKSSVRVYMEAFLPHYTQMQLGIERYFLKSLEAVRPDLQVIAFEKGEVQKCLLYGINGLGSISFGYPFSYRFLSSFSSLCYLYAIFTRISVAIIQIVLAFMGLSRQAENTALNNQLIKTIRQSFLNGQAISYTKAMADIFYIKDRDALYTQQLVKDLNSLNEDEQITVIVGVAHLGESGSLYEGLEQAGYHLVPKPILAHDTTVIGE